jgi:hypothetical protein
MRNLMLLTACVVALAIASCGDDTTGNQTRFVDQQKVPCNPIVPIRHADEAVQTEAMMAMSKISRQVNFAAATAADKAALYRSLSGSLDAAKLAKIGLSESDLKGSYYKASDYSIVIVGNQMTISAAQIGTRGRVEPQTFRVP